MRKMRWGLPRNTTLRFRQVMRVEKAIDRMLLAARAHHRILSLIEMELDMDELQPVRDRFELELRRAYESGYRCRAREVRRAKE